jgi:flavin reductase (DIM6/NTAB) family NADH-FMN oxidoreductase RutF
MNHQTITITPNELSAHDGYRLLISLVVPRPIAWVSTIGLDGTLNLAPFSFFNAVGGTPPTVMFSVGRREGQAKDTLRNVQETGEFVVNIADHALAEAMVQTSGEWSYEVNEFEMANLEMAESIQVKPPRVAEAPAAMEAKVTQIVPVEGTESTMVLGRVVCYHLRQGLLRQNGLVDANLLKPVARLGGNEYAVLGEVFSMLRPRV